jgi:WbqC-like protein family
MTRVAILQSNYIPWKGYFDLIASVDILIILDSVQFTRRDWRNRNRIKTPDGVKWLTVPVISKGKYLQPIDSVMTDGCGWAASHARALESNYGTTPFFKPVFDQIADIYARPPTSLSVLNRIFTDRVASYLGITTQILSCRDFALMPGKTQRLASLCQQVGASTYVSGPAAKAYLDEGAFESVGIGVEWFDYGPYPDYPQLWGPFVHEVSVLDLLFNCGQDAARLLKTVS